MPKIITAFVAATLTVLGAAGCSESADRSLSVTPAATETSATVGNAAPSLGVCGDIGSAVELIDGLQNGRFPADSRSAAKRFGALVNSAPPELKPSVDHLIGPVVIALQHHEAVGGISTAAAQTDFATIKAWHDDHC